MKGKHVLVVGMARSGIAATKLLCAHGAKVRISDMRPEADFGGALEELRMPGVEFRLGEQSETLLSGIDLLLISPGVPIDSPVVLKARQMGIEVAGELEVALRFAKGTLIAITGTNGKTTTTLVGEIMKNAGKLTHVVGNIGSPVAAIADETKGSDVIVCEVSSFQLESVATFHPDICAILNISEDHLYRHGTMQNYIAHKARIFENQNAADTLVLNYDDAVLRQLTQPIESQLIWFSRTQTPSVGAFVQDEHIVFGAGDAAQKVCPVSEIGIPGAHNLENALAATAIAASAGVPLPVIRHTLRTFQGVEHRLEFIRTLDGVDYINDSKGTNVDSTQKAIEAMQKPTVLMLGGRNNDADFAELGKIVKRSPLIERVVLLGEAAPRLQEALDAAGYKNYTHAGMDFLGALLLAQSMAKPGMNVLLSPACKSFDMFKDYEERGRVFKQLVSELRSMSA